MPVPRPRLSAPLRRLYLRSVAAGTLLATAFVALVLTLDVAHLRGLAAELSEARAGLALLWFFLTLTFSGIQMGIAVVSLDEAGLERLRGVPSVSPDPQAPAS